MSLQFTCDAAQVLKTRQPLDCHDHHRQQEIEAQQSRSALANLLKDATQTTVAAAIDSSKSMSRHSTETVFGTASAQAIAANFDPSSHKGLVRTLREEMGKPTTKAQLPVPFNVPDGQCVTEVDTHNVSG